MLAILPLISMLVIFGLFDSMTQRGQWQKFFAIFGGLVVLTGRCVHLPDPRAEAGTETGQLSEKPCLRVRPTCCEREPGALSVLCGVLPVFRGRAGLLPVSHYL